MDDRELLKRIALGAAAGIVGTFALQGVMAARSKLALNADPPIEEDPGDFMVKKAERALPQKIRRKVPDVVETAAAKSLGLGYGAAFGALYAGLRRGIGPIVGDGAALGLATWAAGYLGWLPAAGLMKPVWEQKTPQILAPAVEHTLFGIITVAIYDWMVGWFLPEPDQALQAMSA